MPGVDAAGGGEEGGKGLEKKRRDVLCQLDIAYIVPFLYED
jgi:hypothetical protein